MVLIASIGYSWAVTMVTTKIPHIEPISINGVAMVFTSIVYLPFAFLNAPEHMT
jgi:hypothetical protein